MKTMQAILALIVATLVTGTFTFAHEEGEVDIETKHRIKLELATDGEPLLIEADDLEIGETRQIYTESGKEVVLTRTEEGVELTVDGEAVELGMHHGTHGLHHISTSGHGDTKVFIKRLGDGEEGEHEVHYTYGEGEGEVMHWVSAAEEARAFAFHIETKSAVDHLLEAGVLDDLDSAKREEILDALRELEGPHEHVKTIEKRIIVLDEDDEEN